MKIFQITISIWGLCIYNTQSQVKNVQKYYKSKLPVSISNEEQSTILQEIKYHIFPVSLQLPERVSDKETR